MRPYRPAEELLFTGRDQESARVSELWRSRNLTILYGPAGIGKTSLLHGGVMPYLWRLGANVLPVGRVSGGPIFPEAAVPSPNSLVRTLLRTWVPETSLPPTGIRRILRLAERGPKPLLVAVDQIEDMYLGDHDDERRELLAALAAARNVHLLLCVRDDRLDALLDEAGDGFPDVALFGLGGLTPRAAAEAIGQPVREATGRAVPPAVAEALVEELLTVRIVDDSGTQRARERAPAVNPLHLQAVCRWMWRTWPEGESSLSGDWPVSVDEALRDALWTAIGEVAAAFERDPVRLCSWAATRFVAPNGEAQVQPQGPAETAGLPNAVLRALSGRGVLRVLRAGDGPAYQVADRRLLEPLGQLAHRAGSLTPPVTRPADRLRAAADALADGDPARAERQARLAASAAAHDIRVQIDAHTVLGNLAFARRDLEQAQEAYRRVLVLLETQQDEAAVGVMLAAIGRLSLARGDVAAAQGLLRAAAGRLPADPFIRIELARALAEAGQRAAAVAILRSVMTAAEDDEARILHGRLMAEMSGRPA
ncbi:tetratricopeptide repeat protein [Nonomuraea sp. NPDC049486]|uniref:nSTAND1 domain-containing NTPase n=1 Tax=Nonomuraea sp. NPDC049486 TaxID=3155773 RepID=UPI0034476313